MLLTLAFLAGICWRTEVDVIDEIETTSEVGGVDRDALVVFEELCMVGYRKETDG